MKRLIKIIAVVIILCSSNIVVAKDLGIAIDRAVISIDSIGGEQQSIELGIKNFSKNKEKISIGSIDYNLGENNKLEFIDRDSAVGIKKWVIIDDKVIWLEPGESRKIKLILNVPTSASIGSHYGAIVFRVESGKNDSVKINGQIGVHILVNVGEGANSRGRLNNFSTTFWSRGLNVYSAEFENIGNAHYMPEGEVVIRNVITNFEEKYSCDKHFVFPGKKFTFSLEKKIPSVFGLYKARVIFIDGNDDIHSQSNLTVGYLFPIICLGVVIVMGIMVRFIFFRRLKK